MPVTSPRHLTRHATDAAGDAALGRWAVMSLAARACQCLVMGLFLAALAACGIPPGVGPGASPLDPRTAAQPSPDALSPAVLLAQAQAAWTVLQARGRVDDEAALARITALLGRLLQAAAVIEPQIAGWRATAVLVAGESPDAWCLPQGGCALTRAMAAAGDDHVAVALAHELAHLLRDHPRERLVLGRPGPAPAPETLASRGGADPWLAQPYHRVHEIEADRLAVELLARAGFDPRVAMQFWRTLSAAPLPRAAIRPSREPADAPSGGSVSFLTRHPAPPTRMRDLEVYAERMRPFFVVPER